MFAVIGIIFAALAVVFYSLTVAEARSVGPKEEQNRPLPSPWNPIAVAAAYYRKRSKQAAIGWLPALTLASIAGAVYAFLRAFGLV